MNVLTLTDGRAPGAANMEKDAGLVRSLERGDIPPAVRLYGWAPPAVSLGFHQREADFDAAALGRAGIDLVRRPTGGRAILHAHELTYCAVLPLSLGPPRALYTMIHEALLLGITSMGIQASLEESGSDLHGAYAGPEGIPCFSFSVKSEIRAGGRKLVGSAQRRFGRSILQHGSFLLGPQHLDLARFVRVPAGGDADGLSAWLASRTTDAGTVLGRVVTFEEARDAVAAGFTRYFSRIPEPRELPGGAPVSSTVHL